MARRKKKHQEGAAEPEHVDLGGDEHAWWAAGSIDPFAHASEPPPPPEPEPEPEPEPVPTTRDPYEVLRVASTASWDEIVTSHRKLVRWWHPDGLGDGADEEQKEFCAARMREVNEAYQLLRIRRGK